MPFYNIVRYYASDKEPRVVRSGLTLAEAQAHCRNPRTKQERMTKTGMKLIWFEGYTEMRRTPAWAKGEPRLMKFPCGEDGLKPCPHHAEGRVACWDSALGGGMDRTKCPGRIE